MISQLIETNLHSSAKLWILALLAFAAAWPLQADSGGLAASKCLPSCNTHGTCNEELGRCDCPKHRVGADCSEAPDVQSLEKRCKAALYPDVKECTTYPQACLNGCNLRGKCTSGFCHCQEGFYGSDCAISLGADGKPLLLAGTSYTTRTKRPHVYVYELPPHLTTWLNVRRLDRPTHNMFTQRLLSSGARTADGDGADWYYIPVRCRGNSDGDIIPKALEYVRNTWPWWNATGGARHAIIHTGDLGVEDTNNSYELVHRLTPNSTWLTHWGLHADKECCGWKKAHRPGLDVVIPVFISSGHFRHFGFDNSPLHPLYTGSPNRYTKFFFAGRICGDRKDPDVGVWPNCRRSDEDYSANVRQKVHYYHSNRSGYLVEPRAQHYDQRLRTSMFCLAPLGGGHGQRQIIVAVMGCIPVTIGDHVHQPFEPQLDWSTFSVAAPEASIPLLHERLEELTLQPGRVKAMQRTLACAAQHMVYSSMTGSVLGDQGKYDAFETTLEVLRVMGKHPGVAPEKLKDLDADFRRFMNCGEEWPADQRPGDAQVPATTSLDGQTSDTEAEEEGSTELLQLDSEDETLTDGDDASRGGMVVGSAQVTPVDYSALCSHSMIDKAKEGRRSSRPQCRDCLMGSSITHGLVGGAICCGTEGDVSECPRAWQ